MTTAVQRAVWLALLCGSLAAQDVGLGARRGTGGARLEAPYTLEVETPHVKWAKPLPGGPIRLLAVPTVNEGRTLVELAQRVELDLTTVSIDPQWDVNKWTMSFGRDYGARAEQGDLRLIYSYLEQELTSEKRFDAILLQLSHGWERLTPASREALSRRVREGAGLVVVRPFESELFPLVPSEKIALPANGSAVLEPGRPVSGAWRTAAPHYITRGIPIGKLPFDYLEHYPYRATAAATVLVEGRHPVVAVGSHGKGRVVALGYRNAGLSPYLPMSAKGRVADAHWEYLYALLCRSVLWAAGREASTAGQWKLPEPPPPPASLAGLRVTPEVISEGDRVEVRWDSGGAETIEITDGFGRVIGRAAGPSPLRILVGRPLTHSGFVRSLPVRFAASSREWDDYEIILPWYGPRSYQPWIPAADEQLRRIGVTTLASPERNFKIIAKADLPGFGIYWYRRDAYLKRKAAFAETGDKKYLTRDVTLQSADWIASLKERLAERVVPIAPLRPLAYYLADESSLTAYTDAYDVDWSPPALEGFRGWLQKEYPSLEALNASWGTSFRRWDGVLPMTTEEAQKHGNFAPWADHRIYMEQEFIRAFAKARELVREIDPEARASISGTQVPTPHNGCNWFEIDQILDYLQPYSGGSQDAMHHLFRPGLLLTGFTGYGLTGRQAQYEQWRRLFYGHAGASIFWYYTLLNPDLTLSEQGKALAEVFGRIQSGVGRVFLNSTVREDGVAIHFSMASIRGAWITDGKITSGMGNAQRTSKNFAELMTRRDAWVKELERQGVQFRFLATPQIEAGGLEKFRVLILPYSIALSDSEAREIERFLDRGGLVYADDQTGRMDERNRWRRPPLWEHGRTGLVRRGPGPIEVRKAVDVDGDFLVTVRNFGASRLVGLLPREKTTVKVPRGAVYDLLRGLPAEAQMEVSPEEPALWLERPTRIARLELDEQLRIRLTDERNAPVDRSVVKVEVFDPAGRRVGYYGGNVTVADGRARWEIPWALNDAPGRWRVRARDVVSGLAAERVVTPRPGL
jgi:hypothetical protein